MISAVLSIVSVFGSMQPGWINLDAGRDIRCVRSGNIVIEVTVSDSADSGTSQTDDLESAAEHMSRGSRHLDNGNYDAALAEYTLALDRDPNSWVAFLLRAYLYQLQKEYRLAIDDLDKSIELNPTVEAHVMRGVAYAFSGDDAAALKDYVVAVGIDPDYGSTYKQRAYIYLRQGNFAGAEADIQEATRLLPDDLEVQHSVGDVLFYAGKMDVAERQWKKMCAVADAKITMNWQRRLAATGHYHGSIDGDCDRELIEAFAACARSRCQF